MEQMRPAVFPFYAAHLHHNLAAASMTPERFRFPGQPPFQFQAAAAAAMFPGLHPMAAHHHPAHSHPHPHPAAVMAHHTLTSQAAAAFQASRGLPPTPQPAHTHTPSSQSHMLQVPMLHPALSICQEELDMLLYGYSSKGGDRQCQGHALSGLNLSQMSASASAAVAAAAAVAAGASGGCSSAATSQAGGSQSGEQQSEAVAFGIDKILAVPQSSPGSVSSSSAKASQPNLDTASLELPEGIAIVQTTFAGVVHHGVFCAKTVISRSTRYGPFKGRIVHTSEIKTHDDNSNMWEIFQDGKLSHFIDGRGAAGNWMTHVKCARYAQEQNLIAVQADGAIWYEACKDIPQGSELLVWYGDCYLQFMGVPVALKEMADGGAQEEADTSEGFQCDRCGKVFAYKYYRDKHLKYTRCVDQGDRKYPCTLCTRSFEKRDRLRIHILHVHEKHRPHKCMVCAKSFSQSSSLNKHMRVHSGERPYKCVYCNKAFTASSILRTHIRQHSGEKPFKCKHCGKAFASHAAHDSHVRRTHAKERTLACNVCGKAFSQPFELKFHMTSHLKQ